MFYEYGYWKWRFSIVKWNFKDLYGSDSCNMCVFVFDFCWEFVNNYKCVVIY